MTLALIDGDLVAFRAAAAVERKTDWDGVISVTTDIDGAQSEAIETVKAWASLARCRDVRVLFTGPHNFRYQVLPSYKSGRTKGKPLAYWQTVRAVQQAFETQTVDGLEADDLMGILATTPRYEGAIVVTLDKDLKTIPGRHYNPVKDDKPREVSFDEANHYWLYQTLIGDVTDGYKGCPLIGPKKAERILGPVGTPVEALWRQVVQTYQAAKLPASAALQQARVARILRRSDYDKDTKTIRLWSPDGVPELLPLSVACAKANKNPNAQKQTEAEEAA